MSTVTLYVGDNRDHLRRLIDEGVRVHSVVTDPPYGMTSITKRFGGDRAAPAKFGKDGAFARASAGFMGSKWDGTGIERDPEFWRLIHDILLPGGYVVAFSAARTGHWQACAMEMAGFIMHPFLGWVYGQGFPKAHNAAKALDKHFGVAGEVNPTGEPVKRLIPGAQQNATGDWIKTDDRTYQPGEYMPASAAGQQWNGWAYGAQALKPALEPIFVGQKPFSEKNGALNLLRHGVGAINIDGCRAPYAGDEDEAETKGKNRHADFDSGPMTNEIYGKFTKDRGNYNPPGRHPANLLHDGSENVVTLFPSAGPGSAARFFNSFAYTSCDEITAELGCTQQEAVDLAEYLGQHRPPDGPPTFYQGKATKADRAGSKHPTVKPVALMRWLVRLVTPVGGTVLDPFAGSGTTGAAAMAEDFDSLLMEGESQFADDIERRFGIKNSNPLISEDNRNFPTPLGVCNMRTDEEHSFSYSPVAGDTFDDLLGGSPDEFADLLG